MDGWLWRIEVGGGVLGVERYRYCTGAQYDTVTGIVTVMRVVCPRRWRADTLAMHDHGHRVIIIIIITLFRLPARIKAPPSPRLLPRAQNMNERAPRLASPQLTRKYR